MQYSILQRPSFSANHNLDHFLFSELSAILACARVQDFASRISHTVARTIFLETVSPSSNVEISASSSEASVCKDKGPAYLIRIESSIGVSGTLQPADHKSY